MKSNAITRIILFTLAIVLLLGILAAGVIGHMFFNGFRWDFGIGFDEIVGGTVASSGKESADTVQSLKIEWVDGSVTIQEGDVDSIEFSESGASDQNSTMVFKREGSTLRIQYAQKRRFWFFTVGFQTSARKDLTVTVPKGWSADTIRVNAVNAEVAIQDLNANEVQLDTVSADSRLSGCTVQRLNVNTVSGDVTFNGRADRISCDSVSGNCSAVLSAAPKSVDLDSVSGDLRLALPEGSGFTADIDSVSGSISTYLPTTSNHGSQIYGDGACKISADTVSGSIFIEKAA